MTPEPRFTSDDDTRAVSVAITHALTFGITAVLISGLLLTSGQYLASQERYAAENQFTDIGSDVVSHINSFDRLNNSGDDVNAAVEPEYPTRVVGDRYDIRLVETDNPFGTHYVIEIDASVLTNPLQYPVSTETDLEAGSMEGGDAIICLKNGETITIGSECQ